MSFFHIPNENQYLIRKEAHGSARVLAEKKTHIQTHFEYNFVLF